MLYQPSGTWRLLLSPKIVYSCASKGLITRLQLPRRRNTTNFFWPYSARLIKQAEVRRDTRRGLCCLLRRNGGGTASTAGSIAAHCLFLSPSGFGLAWRGAVWPGVVAARTAGQNKSLQANASAVIFLPAFYILPQRYSSNIQCGPLLKVRYFQNRIVVS